LFRNEKITPEDEEEMIRKAAKKIHDYGMDLPAVLFLQSFKPLAYAGGQLGRFMIFPFLFFIGGDISRSGEKFFSIFEQRDNVEKLIRLIEEKAKEEDAKKAGEGDMEKAREGEQTKEGPPRKRGWRRFLPF